MIRVLLADDQALMRHGLRLVLSAQPDISVVAEAADGYEALALCRREAPDVALLDIRMPKLDGLEVARRLLAAPEPVRVVMLTTFDLDSYLYEALELGVSGFFLKDAPPEQLVAGIRAVVAGASLLAPSLTRRVVEAYVSRPAPGTVDDRLAPLTPREREVLALIARGLANAEIAERLVVADATVKTHVGNVLGKLGLRDRTQAVIVAYETGLVRPGGD
jgi:DNA-binding NarL/FixJ family response regulator